MASNIPSPTRLFRYTLALVLIGIGISGRLGPIPGWVGALVLLTALPWGQIHWPQNISGTDRVFRIGLGLVLTGFALTGKVGPVPGWIGLALLLTAAAGRSPLYALIGYKPPVSAEK
jgi:hypothetical protein